MEKKKPLRDADELENSTDGPDDYTSHSFDGPKRSPMRRKEKFRTKDSEVEKKPKDRKRNSRNKIKYDFEY